MRSFGIGFVLAGLIIASASGADAQSPANNGINERISALRNRLQNYQLERVRKEPQKVTLINENETVEVKFEQLVEEFETRKDVAVTVLFHDADFNDKAAETAALSTSVPGKISLENMPAPNAVSKKTAADVTPVAQKRDIEKELTVADVAHQLDQERTQRQEKYAELRRRVQMATRRAHDSAQQINGMVAQIR